MSRVAVVVGSGMAGASAAFHFKKRLGFDRVVVLESEAEVGGHSRSVPTPLGPVDMGVVYIRPDTYPVMAQLIQDSGAELVPADVGIHCHDKGEIIHSSDLPDDAVKALKTDQLRESIADAVSASETMGQVAAKIGIPMKDRERRLKPILGAFSLKLSHPARLIQDAKDKLPIDKRAEWFRVKDGTTSFIKRLLDGCEVITEAACTGLRQITLEDGAAHKYIVAHRDPGFGRKFISADAVVLAVDPECIRQIAVASGEEGGARLKRAGKICPRISWQQVIAILHTDEKVVCPDDDARTKLQKELPGMYRPETNAKVDLMRRYDVLYDVGDPCKGRISHHMRFGFGPGRPVLTYIEGGAAMPRINKTKEIARYTWLHAHLDPEAALASRYLLHGDTKDELQFAGASVSCLLWNEAAAASGMTAAYRAANGRGAGDEPSPKTPWMDITMSRAPWIVLGAEEEENEEEKKEETEEEKKQRKLRERNRAMISYSLTHPPYKRNAKEEEEAKQLQAGGSCGACAAGKSEMEVRQAWWETSPLRDWRLWVAAGSLTAASVVAGYLA